MEDMENDIMTTEGVMLCYLCKTRGALHTLWNMFTHETVLTCGSEQCNESAEAWLNRNYQPRMMVKWTPE